MSLMGVLLNLWSQMVTKFCNNVYREDKWNEKDVVPNDDIFNHSALFRGNVCNLTFDCFSRSYDILKWSFSLQIIFQLLYNVNMQSICIIFRIFERLTVRQLTIKHGYK